LKKRDVVITDGPVQTTSFVSNNGQSGQFPIGGIVGAVVGGVVVVGLIALASVFIVKRRQSRENAVELEYAVYQPFS